MSNINATSSSFSFGKHTYKLFVEAIELFNNIKEIHSTNFRS